MHSAIADLGGPVPVAEGDVVGTGGLDLIVADQPGRVMLFGPVRDRLVMTVGHGHLPAGAALLRLAQGHHIAVIKMRMAPYLQIQRFQMHRLVVGQPKHMNAVDSAQPAALVGRALHRRIMIAGQDDHRHACRPQQLGGLLQHRFRQAIVFEHVASHQHRIGIQPGCSLQHNAQPHGCDAAIDFGAVTMIDMQVRGMDQNDVA